LQSCGDNRSFSEGCRSCSRAVQYTVMEVQIYNKNQLNQIITAAQYFISTSARQLHCQ
jgi:hypothetical protein